MPIIYSATLCLPHHHHVTLSKPYTRSYSSYVHLHILINRQFSRSGMMTVPNLHTVTKTNGGSNKHLSVRTNRQSTWRALSKPSTTCISRGSTSSRRNGLRCSPLLNPRHSEDWWIIICKYWYILNCWFDRFTRRVHCPPLNKSILVQIFQALRVVVLLIAKLISVGTVESIHPFPYP